jgi:hypothetical protein
MKANAFLSTATLATVLLIGGINSRADGTNAPVQLPATDVIEEVPYQPFETRLEIGPTTGVGVTESIRFMDHLGVSGGIDYWDAGYTHSISDVDYHANLRFLNVPVTLDVYPWRTSSFHISGGVVLNQNRVFGEASPSANSTITINGTTYTGAQVGTLHLAIRQEPVDPYLAVGGDFVNFDNKHWAFGWTLGVMYTGNPRVQLSNTGGNGSVPQSDIDGEKNKIIHYARQLEFWPVFKIGFSYAF